jgi:hypothetical protein
MSCCVLINTCPKYKFLALAQVILIRRYAPDLSLPIYLACSEFTKNDLVKLDEMNIRVIHQTQEENGDFIGCRIHALKKIKETTEYEYIILLQEDFLLDRTPSYSYIEKSLGLMQENTDIACIRLMPCPGPANTQQSDKLLQQNWLEILPNEAYFFSFQAAIWRLPWVLDFFVEMTKESQEYLAGKPIQIRNHYWIRMNPCEQELGQKVAIKLLSLRSAENGIFLGYPRRCPWPNGVLLSPWPYRPTAVEKGILQQWAIDFLSREGLSVRNQTSL